MPKVSQDVFGKGILNSCSLCRQIGLWELGSRVQWAIQAMQESSFGPTLLVEV